MSHSLITADRLRHLWLFGEASRMTTELIRERPDDPEPRLLHLRILRDLGDAEAVIRQCEEWADPRPALLAERIAAGCRLRRHTETGALVAGAERDIADGRYHGDDGLRYLRVAIARWHASRGEVNRGLRVLGEETGSVTVFTLRLILLLRLGRHRDIRGEIGQGFTRSDSGSGFAAGQAEVRWLTSAGRIQERIGDLPGAVESLHRAMDVARDVASTHGIWLANPWRWLARLHHHRSDVAESRRLLADTEDPAKFSLPAGPDGPRRPMSEHPVILLERARQLGRGRYAARHDWGPEALRLLDRCDALSGGFTESLVTRAQVLRASGAGAELRRLAEERDATADLTVEYGQYLVDRGRRAAALSVVAGVLATDPFQREALLARILLCADRHSPADPAEVTAAADDLRERLPEDPIVLCLAGEGLAQRGFYTEADRLFRQAIAANPSHGIVWAGLIRCWSWARRFDTVARIEEELADRERALATDPGASPVPRVRILLALGMVEGDQLNYQGAARLFAEAERTFLRQREAGIPMRSETLATVLQWQVTALRWQLRLREAEAAVLTARERFPDSPELAEEHGWLLVDQYRPGAALREFDRALARSPRHPGATRGRIHALRMLKRYRQAHQEASAAQRELPRDVTIRCEHAWLHGEQHRYEEALTALDTALAIEPGNPHALAWRARYLTKAGRHAEAVTAAERAWHRRPENPEVRDALSHALLKRGEPDEAVERVRETAAAPITDVVTAVQAATVYARAGRWDRDARGLADRLAAHTDKPEAVRTAAALYRANLQLATAEAVVRRCMAAGNRSDPRLWSELAEIAAVRGDFDQVAAHLRRCADQLPHSRTLIKRRAHLLMIQGDGEEAIRLLRTEIARRPTSTRLRVLLGEHLVATGDPHGALSLLRHIEEEDLSIRGRILRLRAIRATGRIDRALELAWRLRRDYPASGRARLALAGSLEDVHRRTEALRELSDVVRELPVNPAVVAQTAFLHRLDGNYEKAEAVLSWALRHLPHDAGLLTDLAWARIRLGTGGGEQFDELIESADVNARMLAHCGRGWLALRDGSPDTARHHFTEAMGFGLACTEALYGLVVCGLREVEQSTAGPGLRRTYLVNAREQVRELLSHERSERSLTLAGYVEFHLGDLHRAREHLSAAIRVHPAQGPYTALGLVLTSLGELDRAQDVLTAGLARNPGSPGIRAMLGTVHLQAAIRYPGGEHAGLAEDCFASVLSESPHHPVAVRGRVMADILRWRRIAQAAPARRWPRWRQRERPSAQTSDMERLLTETIEAQTGDRKPLVAADLMEVHAEWLLCRYRVSGDPELLERARRQAGRAHVTSRAPRARLIVEQCEAWQAAVDGPGEDPAEGNLPRLRQWVEQGVGWTVSALAMAGIGLIVFRFLLTAPTDSPAAAVALLLPLLVAALAGVMVNQLKSIHNPLLRIDRHDPPELDASPNALPDTGENLMPGLAGGFEPDAGPPGWLSDTRFPRLGPAVGLLVTGYYANRDAYYPWRPG
ncbi:Tfp pilus assembly protein PilF [Stackebrandtia albiflava]|uniref:Tfp pilus assembly protein PilF n=1 Tax=Stackebrandtia albiflava TaxID=406432 RepID=A0A562V9Y4_9ACTN|nr:tetratricopeptide repeat protein [Stackebrandtia albiflava]TWJ14627.1 Tfp pilus assembly protein PilF [Stackebrandtia albiflava]